MAAGRKWVEATAPRCLCYRPGPRELKQHPVVAACGPAARPGWCLPGSSLAPAELRAAVKPTPYSHLRRYTASSRDSRLWPGAASERPVTPHLAQALSAPPRHFHSLPPHSSPTVTTGVSPATRRLFATEPGSPTPPPPLDDSPRSLPGGSQIPSPPLAPAVIRSWRPLPGHQEQPRRPLRAATLLLERRDGLSQILKAVPAPQQARKTKVTPFADQAEQFCHQRPPLSRARIHNTHVQFFKHWKSSVYSVQTKFVPRVSVPLLCLD